MQISYFIVHLVPVNTRRRNLTLHSRAFLALIDVTTPRCSLRHLPCSSQPPFQLSPTCDYWRKRHLLPWASEACSHLSFTSEPSSIFTDCFLPWQWSPDRDGRACSGAIITPDLNVLRDPLISKQAAARAVECLFNWIIFSVFDRQGNEKMSYRTPAKLSKSRMRSMEIIKFRRKHIHTHTHKHKMVKADLQFPILEKKFHCFP